MPERRSILRTAVVTAVMVAIFALLGLRLYRDARILRLEDWKLDPPKLALSFLLLIGSLTLSALVWKKILHLYNVDLQFRKCFKITFVSSMGKYLPGKVWAYVSQAYLAQKVGVPVGVCLISAAVLFLAYAFSGLLLFGLTLSVWSGLPWALVVLIPAVLLACLLALFSPWFPALMVRVAGRLSRRFRESAAPDGIRPDVSAPAVVAVLSVLAADWIVLIAAIYFMVNSFYAISLSQAVIVCGTLAASVIGGVLAFFIPAGLGVREGVGSYVLSVWMPPAIAIVIVLALRVWLSVGELICFLAALRIREPRLS